MPITKTTATTQDPAKKDYYIPQAFDKITRKPERKRKLPSSPRVTYLRSKNALLIKTTRNVTDPRQITTPKIATELDLTFDIRMGTLTRNRDIKLLQHEQTENKYNIFQ